MGKGDAAAQLGKDLRRAGGGYCNPVAVHMLAEGEPQAVLKLNLSLQASRFKRIQGDKSCSP